MAPTPPPGIYIPGAVVAALLPLIVERALYAVAVSYHGEDKWN